nr:hypothetical protein [uncultured Oscillibacter sp.]
MRKLLSAAVALSLCASLAAPASSFDDLQDAIDGNTETGTWIEDSDYEDHYGYDWDEDDANTMITVEDDAAIDLNGSDIDGGCEAGVSEGSKDSVITVDIPVFEGEIPARPGYTFAGGGLVNGEDFGSENGIVTGVLTLVAAWIPIPVEPEVPEEPDNTGDTDDAEDAGTTIDEGAVPLASGPVTRAEFVDHLWRHEGQPAPRGCQRIV